MTFTPDNAPTTRDPRLDFFRGLCLAMIFINHVPGTMFEHVTSRNFGLSDAAEGFVFMSGWAVALAYGPRLAEGLNWLATHKAWVRAWDLYLVHLFTTIWAVAIVAGAVVFLGADEVLKNNSFSLFRDNTYPAIFGIATLGHQFGYVNILPMYAALMLAAPFLVRLGQKSPWALIAVSTLIWIAAQHWGLNLPNYPQPGGWFFNPLSWQIVFVCGLLVGLAARRGLSFPPATRWLLVPALAWLAFALVWAQSPALTEAMNNILARARAAGAPALFASVDKTSVALPRLLHFLALAYVLSVLPFVARWAAARWAAPIRTIGRHGLPIFAVGTVLAIFAQSVRDIHPAGAAQDAALILGGLALQWIFAASLEYIRRLNLARKAALAASA